MSANRDKRIRYFVDSIRSRLDQNVQQIFLFGSHARGEASDRSDYDFAIIVRERTRECINQVRETEVDFLNRFDRLSASLVFDECEWQIRQQLPIGINILREGVAM